MSKRNSWAMCLLYLTTACSGAAEAQVSPEERASRVLAQVILEIQETNALLPIGFYNAKIEAMKGVVAPDCPDAGSASLDLRIASSKLVTSESVGLLADARLSLSTARLAKAKNEPGADSTMDQAVEKFVLASIQAQVLGNRNVGSEFFQAVANSEVVQALCMTAEQHRVKTRLEALKNRELIKIVASPLFKSIRPKPVVRELVDSTSELEARALEARKGNPRSIEADTKLKALAANNDPDLVPSRRALDEAIRLAARGR